MNDPPSSALPEGLSGLIELVTFHSEGTGFGVLRVKRERVRRLFPVPPGPRIG